MAIICTVWRSPRIIRAHKKGKKLIRHQAKGSSRKHDHFTKHDHFIKLDHFIRVVNVFFITYEHFFHRRMYSTDSYVN